ncbi:hypothetical protein [Aneurinibacillus uraniidurans]|uniref:hypothetical protein n=1 Tax=Aneurinibacillus uraniidurans TaxID=2966586 RepID=UPI00234969CA|nr:hypothetical protein [Aneurinibacillus sp. B1]WCN38965.1 hypothetical protein PO771_06090 [Aneurinibacillus sp. B1]
MKIDTALFDYLQIKVVADARPDDTAAQQTADFFRSILEQDHQLEKLDVTHDETMYHVTYTTAGKTKMRMYDRESVEVMLAAIEREPRYGQ